MDINEEDESMERFLNSKYISKHILSTIKLSDFFYYFHAYCDLKKIKAPKKKYKECWNRHKISCIRRKTLLGVEVVITPADRLYHHLYTPYNPRIIS